MAVEREYRTRVCRECGMPLNVYGGMCDHEGEPARFLFDNNIRAFRKDYGAVKEGMRILLETRDGDGVKLSEVSPKVQLMVSREECLNPGVYADSHDEENVSRGSPGAPGFGSDRLAHHGMSTHWGLPLQSERASDAITAEQDGRAVTAFPFGLHSRWRPPPS